MRLREVVRVRPVRRVGLRGRRIRGAVPAPRCRPLVVDLARVGEGAVEGGGDEDQRP